MARYRRTTTNRDAERARREEEQFRKELRDDVMRELKTALNGWKKDIEREFSQALRSGESTRSSGSSGSSEGGFNLGGIGSALAGLAFSLLSRSRTKTTTTAATESGRSRDENAFYRQSLSQRKAAASLASQEGQRNL